LISENGKEFENTKLKKWIESRKIDHQFSVPYYHQGNGRVERVNRTLRTALMKTKGSIRKKL
jgi:transposase InsO family protein